MSRPRFEQFLRNLAHWCTYHNLPWYWYCFRGRVQSGGKGRFWCAACKSVSRTCSTSTLFCIYFVLFTVVHFCHRRVFAFVVLDLAFSVLSKARAWLGRTSPKWPILLVGPWNCNVINQSLTTGLCLVSLSEWRWSKINGFSGLTMEHFCVKFWLSYLHHSLRYHSQRQRDTDKWR